MRIATVHPQPDWTLLITTTENIVGSFDVKPYFCYEAFEPLKDASEFFNISNGGYFVEWKCGADLSADTIGAKMAIRSS
jgi:hypothetical protein